MFSQMGSDKPNSLALSADCASQEEVNDFMSSLASLPRDQVAFVRCRVARCSTYRNPRDTSPPLSAYRTMVLYTEDELKINHVMVLHFEVRLALPCLAWPCL